MKIDEFKALIQPIERPLRTFHCGFNYLEKWLEHEENDWKHGIDLNPDFQRGHVWTEQQQAHYLENVLRQIVDESGLTIRFNNPNWGNEKSTDLDEKTVCIDGLQRLTAIRKFIKGEISVFGIDYAELPIRVMLRDLRIIIQMYDFKSRADLLSFYLDINTGGTPHSHFEITRVKNLLKKAQEDNKDGL